MLLGAASGLGGLALARGLRKTAAPSVSWRTWAAASLVVVLAASVSGLILHYRRQGRIAANEAGERLTIMRESLMMMRLVKCYVMETFNQNT